MSLDRAAEVLNQYWGFPSFREMQDKIVHSVLDGKDTLALLPTGGGKSICFQVPAMCNQGICLVVSPLIALMKDQVDSLNAKGIKAYRISSDLSYREIDLILDNCIYGQVKFLYVSPERLKTEVFIERFSKMPVNLIAIDEAHCISQWGYDFRPPYREIAKIRPMHPEVPVIALTATATKEVVEDIQNQLEFEAPNVFKARFERSNLSYVVREVENKYDKLIEICSKIVGTGIVYVSSRKRTKEIADYLSQRNFSADYFHAGLNAKTKELKQDRWIKNQTRIIVSTNAFGMGIDKPDVHFVVHMDIPNDLESYFQEAGRAGRDGRKSYAVILHNNQDVIELKERWKNKYPDFETIKKVYKSIGSHLQMAIGTGKNSVHEFRVNEFSNKYNFSIKEVYNSIHLLELSGVISMNESTYNPARVMVLLNRKDLYSFQLNNERLNNLIQILLRSYEGIFDMFIKVETRDIAKRLGKTEEELISELISLQKKGVIHYIPQNDQPKLVFLEDRLPEDSIILDREVYRLRKESDRIRLDAMLSYLDQRRCRSLILREYFDDLEGGECGVCDICVEKKRMQITSSDFSLIEKEILGLIGREPLGIEELIATIENAKKEEVIKVVRWLMDEGRLEYNEENYLVLKND